MALACATDAGRVAGRDYVLIIGGGYAHSGNQASLEKNVLFAERTLAAAGVGGTPAVFFADGDDKGADLQVRDLAAVPKANQLMAEFFGTEEDLGLNYRNHAVPGVRGSTNKANIVRWFEETGPKLAAGDRLLLYVSAHGERGSRRRNAYDTAIALWDNEELRVSELARLLDGLPQGVSVTMVMVQCYTGGFARLIYRGADPEQGLAPQRRCGFFATVHDRVAAGCTPDVDKASYVEYSSYFWAALGGRSQTGETIEKPDYDGDGRVSLAEAHAYTVLHADTIDLPLTTSSEFLNGQSQFADDEHPKLLAEDAPYDEVLKLATPAERAVLEGLSAELALSGNDRIAAANDAADDSPRRRGRGGRGAGRLRETIADDLSERWPAVSNVLNPGAIELVTTRSEEFIAAVEGHARYVEYRELTTAADSAVDPEKRRVKYERFVATADDVILRENLRRLGDAKRVAEYEAIAAAEGLPLGGAAIK